MGGDRGHQLTVDAVAHWHAVEWFGNSVGRTTSGLSAQVQVHYASTNVFLAECDRMLPRLYMVEALQLAIAVQFDPPLSEVQARHVRWFYDAGDVLNVTVAAAADHPKLRPAFALG